jgi:siroheme synthase-like protein
MEYFPIAIALHGKSCLVVGGGNVALRKATKLVQSGARVTVVSPTVVDGFSTLGVSIVLREFKLEDIEGKYALVVSATDNPELNSSILALCDSEGILCNSATEHAHNGCIFPSVVEYEGITVGVSTDGISPSVSKSIRKDIQENVLPKYSQELKRSKRRV